MCADVPCVGGLAGPNCGNIAVRRISPPR
jgi:hypothetical protein